jgi:flagellar protein FliL
MKTGQEEAKPVPSGRRKLVRRGLVAVVALALIGAGAVYGLGLMGGDEAEEVSDAAAEPAEGEHAEAEGGEHAATPAETLVVAPLDEIIVNIAATTASGRETQRFLKLNLALVYDSASMGAERLAERSVYIRDSYIDYLRLLNERDLRGSAGLARLRAELLHRARSLAETEAPREVLVVDLVIQ